MSSSQEEAKKAIDEALHQKAQLAQEIKANHQLFKQNEAERLTGENSEADDKLEQECKEAWDAFWRTNVQMAGRSMGYDQFVNILMAINDWSKDLGDALHASLREMKIAPEQLALQGLELGLQGAGLAVRAALTPEWLAINALGRAVGLKSSIESKAKFDADVYGLWEGMTNTLNDAVGRPRDVFLNKAEVEQSAEVTAEGKLEFKAVNTPNLNAENVENLNKAMHKAFLAAKGYVADSEHVFKNTTDGTTLTQAKFDELKPDLDKFCTNKIGLYLTNEIKKIAAQAPGNVSSAPLPSTPPPSRMP